MLGLTVREEGKMLIWERGPKRATGPYQTQHILILRKASRALRVAAAFIKRRAADMTKG